MARHLQSRRYGSVRSGGRRRNRTKTLQPGPVAMENPALVVLSQQTALSKQMDVIANNLANVNTPAYRSENLLFNEFLGKATNPGIGGTGSRIAFVGLGGTLPDTRPGPIEPTGNQLDFALQG